MSVGNGIEQQLLDYMVEALHKRSMSLTPSNVEAVTRAAHYLSMPAILEACTRYIYTHVAVVGKQVISLHGSERTWVSHASMYGINVDHAKIVCLPGLTRP